MTIHGTQNLITLIKVLCKIRSASMTCYALSPLYHTVYNLASHRRSSKKSLI